MFYRAYSPGLVLNKNDKALQDLFFHSQTKEQRLRKLEDLKKARHEILNEEQRPVKKLKQKNQPKMNINEKHMDSEFTNEKPSDDVLKEYEPEPQPRPQIDKRDIEGLKSNFVLRVISQESRKEVAPIS